MENKRKYKRTKLTNDFAIDINLNNILVPVFIEDISMGGAKLKCDKYIKPGTKIVLKFTLNDSMNAEVRWAGRSQEEAIYYVGVQFSKEWEGDTASLRVANGIVSREFQRRVPLADIRFYVWDINLVGHKQYVTLLDISEGGAKLRVKIPWDVGTVLNLNIKKGVLLTGEVRSRDVFEGTDLAKPEFAIGVKFRKKEDNDVIRLIKEKISKDPKNIDNYNKIAIELRKENRYSEAIDNYKKAIEYESDNEVLHFNLARVYLDLKKLELAIGHLKKAIEIDSQFYIAKTLLEKTEEKLKN